MSFFELVLQMIAEQWPLLVVGLLIVLQVLSSVYVAIRISSSLAIFFGTKGKDSDNLDDDESFGLDQGMKLWGPAELSINRKFRKIELVRETPTPEHDPNNSGLEIASDTSKDEPAYLNNQRESNEKVLAIEYDNAAEVFVVIAEEPANEKEKDEEINENAKDDDTISLEQPIEDNLTARDKEMSEDDISHKQPYEINDFESPMMKSTNYSAEKSLNQKKKKSTWSKLKDFCCCWKKNSKSK